jgi:hypothetical protein
MVDVVCKVEYCWKTTELCSSRMIVNSIVMRHGYGWNFSERIANYLSSGHSQLSQKVAESKPAVKVDFWDFAPNV